MKIKFLPLNLEVETTPEKTLLQVALEHGVDIKSICKGKLVCAECRVKVIEGESNCLPPSKAELNLIGTSWQLDSRRFACQIRCFGDVTVDLTEQIQRAESQRKNIRGYKSSRPATESIAVIDTMLLTEKIEAPSEEPRPQQQQQQQRPPQQRPPQQGQRPKGEQGKDGSPQPPRGGGRGGRGGQGRGGNNNGGRR